jgi:hypothetical protein
MSIRGEILSSTLASLMVLVVAMVFLIANRFLRTGVQEVSRF